VDRAISPRLLTGREITPEIEDLDPFVLGCGGIRYDEDAETYLREVFLAYELGVPVILNAISADADVKACR
jgi:selenocysteine lyase/cysteine desulfurase